MLIVNYKELEEENKVNYYYCGSIPLARFLIKNEHYPVSSTISKNKKLLYLFIKCDSLSLLLTEWSGNNPNLGKYKNGGKTNEN